MNEAPDPQSGPPDDEQERWAVLTQLEEWLEQPMLILSFIWLSLVIVELVWTSSGVFEWLGILIWILFVLEFLLRFALAPRKFRFLRGNPITIVALVAPAFRFLRVLRLLRLTRGLRLVRIVGTANRSFGAMRKSFGRRGLGYMLATTTLVILLGAGGMLAFEPAGEVSGGFSGYAEAVWWTAMLVSTTGSEFWPSTAEGRVLALLLAIYGLAIFGYIAASLATFFIGQEAAAVESDVAGSREIAALREDIAALRQELHQMASR
ncbi:ion transporter [Devosia sp. RR2S18]|uniref:ion transporter n=1 Tax=Devosia rhizosphaerae TaxID=3049774 RepID=UPI002540DA78|nr:ion transporter [Devosia sp. RR2S18]WIJ25903.1 ion transporter [Devosia sp. RR2S18]